MSTTIAPHQPSRKQSFLRHKIRESFRPSALREYLHQSEKDGNHTEKPRTSVDGKRASMEESSWISRKRRKNKPAIAEDDKPKHVLEDLKIDVGGFDDLKMSLDPGSGSDLYSLRSPDAMLSPATVAATATKETVLTLKPPQKPLMQKLNQYSPIKDQKMTFPQAMELEDTSSNVGKSSDAMDMDIEPPAQQPQLEVRKGPKWQVKTDNLVRPVSSGRANALAANVSQTIAAINKNNFHANSKWNANADSMASARPSMESGRSKMTSQTNYTDKVDSVLGSNASITTTHGAMRRPLGDTARTNTNRHTITDVDKLISSTVVEQENKRQSFPPVAVRRQSLMNMHSTQAQQERPRSPTGSIASTATGAPRARRQSGTNVSSRLSWIQDLENAGKKGPGQEYMMNKLSGGVAEKLRRFESQNSQPIGSASRSQSATRSTSATRRGSEAYGIEAGPKRLSRTVTADDDFRKKLEEQFQRKAKEDEEKERKKLNRTSLPIHTGRTPQQIIDYVELNDKDREAEINDLMQDGNGIENARKLDLQAKAALNSQVKSGPKQANAVFQNATAALRSTTNLLDMGVPSTGSSTQNSKSTPSLQRTMSVQARARKVSPSLAQPPRPVSYAPPVSAPMDDDEYDPFNYAVYPSRSSIYSNPPEAPARTPEIGSEEVEVFGAADGIEGSTATLVEAVDEELEAEKAIEDSSVVEESVPTPATFNNPESKIAESPSPAELPKSKDAPSATPSTPIEPPKEAPKPATGWAARFQSQPSALPLRIHGNPSKPAAVQASAAPTSAPREEDDSADDAEMERSSSEELVAQEAIPASPTLVEISRPSSKRTTPVKERFVDVESQASVQEPVKVVEEARPATPAKKATPSELVGAGGSVKIASPCRSPKSPRKYEFNAAALPRLGTA